MTATTTLPSFGNNSNSEKLQAAFQRIRAVRSRPSTAAAQEFFADPNDDWMTLPRRLKRLVQVFEEWDADLKDKTLSSSLSKDPAESRRLAMTAAIFGKAPPKFLESFRRLFCEALRMRSSEDDQEEGLQDEATLYSSLRTLGWIRRYGKLNQPLGEALHETILLNVRNIIKDEYEESNFFQTIQTWKDSTINPWLFDLLGQEAYETDDWATRLEYCACECFCMVRVDEIFNIVTDYPDSNPAVLELRDIIQKTGKHMHTQLGHALCDSLKRRLIHPGANTSQIIDVYINTIKVLRVIDPSDRLLETVAEPVRSYLRGRSDTVRCIITSLTDEQSGGDLYEELRRQDARPLEQAELDSDDEEEAPDLLEWKPPLSITKQQQQRGGSSSSSRGNGGDILSMLVSIYGSKELFVNEYRLMLADKLLANLDYTTDKEVHTLELLKLRFGEMSMRQCEIMIKDTDDSKRVVSNIHSITKNKEKDSLHKNKEISSEAEASSHEPVVDAIIVSHIFWPALLKEPLKQHPRIQAQLDEFSQEYAKLKNPRRLVWLNQLGTVQLELDVIEEQGCNTNGSGGAPVIETRKFSCSPLLATLVSHFEDKDEWTSGDLSNETGIPEHIIQKRMNYWINNRVVKVISNTATSTTNDDFFIDNHDNDDSNMVRYQLASREYWLVAGEPASANPSLSGTGHDDDGQDGSERAISGGAQDEEEMDTYESYISGMLNTFGQLAIDQIHNKLKTFVAGSDHKYNKTPRQLSAFLQHLCKEERLECGPDGMYKLLKK